MNRLETRYPFGLASSSLNDSWRVPSAPAGFFRSHVIADDPWTLVSRPTETGPVCHRLTVEILPSGVPARRWLSNPTCQDTSALCCLIIVDYLGATVS
jgi:hypothetical protein